tara:strand:+ start:1133 stop:2890 length:1758 start_codon:yes stop_codon:yes gene_type:complete
MMVIEINNTKINGRVEGTDTFEVTLSRKGTDNAIGKSFSSELTFYDDGYQILKNALIDDPEGFIQFVNVDIYDDCCNEKVYSGIIRGDGIDWCEPVCSITASIVESDPDIDCIKSTVLADDHNGFFSSQQHPAIRYCLELRPNFVQALLILLASALQTLIFSIMIALIFVVIIIFGIIYVFCNIIAGICSIPLIPCNPPNCNSGFTNPINVINEITDIFDSIANWMLGCGRFHPSPYVRDYIKNVCDKCGLQFQSSILNDPASLYYKTVLFSAPIHKGRKPASTDFDLIAGNEPLLTLSDFLTNYLSRVYNGDWHVANGILTFERKDYFFQTIEWLDSVTLMAEDKIIDNEICFNWKDDERPAFGKFTYALDSQDYIGNEGKTRYEDIVEWNNPVSEMQSGEKLISLPFGMARFRNDGVETDIYTMFNKTFFNLIWGGAFSTYNRALLLNQHTAFQMKLLLLSDNFYSISDPTVSFVWHNVYTGGNVYAGGEIVAENERYNYPYWFKADNELNLYDQFWSIDDPRNPSSQQFDFSFEFAFDCEDWQSFGFDKYVKLMKGGVVKHGQVKELKVNFSKRVMTVNGTV